MLDHNSSPLPALPLFSSTFVLLGLIQHGSSLPTTLLQDFIRAMVWFALGGPTNAPEDLIELGYTPRDGEWEAPVSVDKFFGSKLDEKLKPRGIKTVILCDVSGVTIVAI